MFVEIRTKYYSFVLKWIFLFNKAKRILSLQEQFFLINSQMLHLCLCLSYNGITIFTYNCTLRHEQTWSL